MHRGYFPVKVLLCAVDFSESYILDMFGLSRTLSAIRSPCTLGVRKIKVSVSCYELLSVIRDFYTKAYRRNEYKSRVDRLYLSFLCLNMDNFKHLTFK